MLSNFGDCVVPELLGKWYTRKDTSIVTQVTQEQSIEEDSGIWCVCREVKGGSMIACDDKACGTQWFHLECVGLTEVPSGKWLCPTCKK